MIHNGVDKEVQNCFVDSILRDISEDELQSFFDQNGYIEVSQFGNREFKLTANGRLLGGGLFGASAGCWIGKFVASAICHTAIFAVGGVVSLVATPAVGGIAIASLESTFAAPIEAFTTAVAVAGGITGAVITGPV